MKSRLLNLILSIIRVSFRVFIAGFCKDELTELLFGLRYVHLTELSLSKFIAAYVAHANVAIEQFLTCAFVAILHLAGNASHFLVSLTDHAFTS